MLPTTRSSSAGVAAPSVVIAIAAAAVIAAVAAASLGVIGAPSAPSGGPSPSVPVATPAPTADVPGPTAVPTPVVTPAPSLPLVTPGPDGVDGARIPLHVFGDAVVTLDVSDRDGLLTDAVTGEAKDGMSVRWGDALVRTLDERTVEVTWVGLPGDEAATLVVKRDGAGITVRFGQLAPPPYSDAMGADRVVVLTFAAPVDAAGISVDMTTADD